MLNNFTETKDEIQIKNYNLKKERRCFMKNKNLIIIIVVVVIIILAAVFLLTKGKNTVQNPAGNQNAITQNDQTAQKPSIKDNLIGLLQSTSGVKCSVTDANGSYTIIAKGDKAKIDGINYASPQSQNQNGQKGTMINDGTWAYIWSGQQGMKFNMAEIQKSAKNQNPDEQASDWKSWAANMQASGAKYDCNATVATDADFTPPSDVTFQDLGELMKNFQKNQPAPTGNTSVPAVPAMPNSAEPQL
jgi:hypothetical protein